MKVTWKRVVGELLAVALIIGLVAFCISDAKAQSVQRMSQGLICDTQEQVIEWLNMSTDQSMAAEVEGCGFLLTPVTARITPLNSYKYGGFEFLLAQFEFLQEGEVYAVQYGYIAYRQVTEKVEYDI